jgi:hypothetical protein
MTPRITFGMIVLNGEPFTRYNLRALYPFAHQIIVVEGAVASNTANATPDGHSLDGTLDVLQAFKRDEDPDNKVVLVTKDGFWSEKDEMSQAYAQHATGDYLWQVDNDEFYLPQDMQQIINLLRENPSITQITVPTRTFWGGLEYVVDGWYLRTEGDYQRIFKWDTGYRYVKHRPPTVHNAQNQNVRYIRPISATTLRKKGIIMAHYSLLFPSQVTRKSAYYSRVAWEPAKNVDAMENWAHDNFLHLKNPFRVHNVYQYPSWLERYKGEHPPQILAMWRDMATGVIAIERRRTDDIERLLANPLYQLARPIVQYSDDVLEIGRIINRFWRRVWGKIRYEMSKRP